jgi:hypothetical protein
MSWSDAPARAEPRMRQTPSGAEIIHRAATCWVTSQVASRSAGARPASLSEISSAAPRRPPALLPARHGTLARVHLIQERPDLLGFADIVGTTRQSWYGGQLWRGSTTQTRRRSPPSPRASHAVARPMQYRPRDDRHRGSRGASGDGTLNRPSRWVCGGDGISPAACDRRSTGGGRVVAWVSAAVLGADRDGVRRAGRSRQTTVFIVLTVVMTVIVFSCIATCCSGDRLADSRRTWTGVCSHEAGYRTNPGSELFGVALQPAPAQYALALGRGAAAHGARSRRSASGSPPGVGRSLG